MTYTKSTEITSHEIACEILDRDTSASITAQQKLDDIRLAIQKITNHDPLKKGTHKRWRGIFYYNYETGAFGFSDSAYVDWCSIAIAGARLCWNFAEKTDSDHFFGFFEALHKEVWES